MRYRKLNVYGLAQMQWDIMSKFKSGQLIRSIKTGQPFFVVHAYTTGIMVVDPTQPNLTPVQVILERDMDDYVRDTDLDCKKKGNDLLWNQSEFGSVQL